jgi:hypothetical protein
VVYPCPETTVTLEELLELLQQYPAIETLPIRLDPSVLPTTGLMTSFDQHMYGPLLSIQRDEHMEEVGDAICQLLPRVTELVVHSDLYGRRWPSLIIWHKTGGKFRVQV